MSNVTIRETVFDSGYYIKYGDWPSKGPIVDLIEWLQKQRDLVPEEHCALAHIDISVEYAYGDSSLSATVFYNRPERPGETQERLANEYEKAKHIEAKERVKLAALKRKYER